MTLIWQSENERSSCILTAFQKGHGSHFQGIIAEELTCCINEQTGAQGSSYLQRQSYWEIVVSEHAVQLGQGKKFMETYLRK